MSNGFTRKYRRPIPQLGDKATRRSMTMAACALVETGRDDLVPVAINDLGSIEANAHLFRYDSVHGHFPRQVTIDAARTS